MAKITRKRRVKKNIKLVSPTFNQLLTTLSL